MGIARLVTVLFLLLGFWVTSAGAEVFVNHVWHDPDPGDPYMTVDPVTYTQNVTWTAAAGPYYVDNAVTVAEGVTLTIEPGTTIYVSGPDNRSSAFYVYGTLNATGTVGSPITFASWGGGYWRGIYLAPSAGASVISHTIIDRAGGYYSGFGLNVSPHGWVWAALYIDDCNPSVTNSQVTNSETTGIKLWSSQATIANNSFQNMGIEDYPIVFDTTDCYPVMGGNSTSGTGYNGVALKDGTIGVSGTWSRPGSNFPYLMRGQIAVDTLAALTIAPGNTIRSNWDAIHVYGSLTAAGTSDLPILFSTRSATPGPGSWRGIYLAPTAVIPSFSHVTIEYAGAYANGFGLNVAPHGWVWASLYLDGISPTLDHLTIRQSETHGIQLYGASPTITASRIENCQEHGLLASNTSRPAITGTAFAGNGSSGYYVVSLDASSVPNPTSVTFSGNTRQGIQVRGGGIGTSALWKKWHNDAPYAVTGFVTVEEGNTLSIEPTATVKVSGVAFHVYGTLTANSTTGRIAFTSLLDDTVAGDTNGDGNATTPAAGNWLGIYLAPTAGASVLHNCTIRYAGAFNSGFGLNVAPHSWVWAALYVDGISPVITGCQILDSQTSGIKLWSSHATIIGTAFQNMGAEDYPIVLDTTDCYPVMSGNTTSGTGYNGVALKNGTIGVSGTWSLPGADFPYLMRGQVAVDPAVALAIAAGTTVKSDGSAIHVYGSLSAAGTSGQPILFSSRSASPTPGSWRGIYLAPTAVIPAFSYVTIEYAGAYASGFGLNVSPHGWVWASLYLDGINPTFDHLTIRQSETHGLQLYAASPTITNGLFENCLQHGLVGSSGSRPVITTAAFNSNGSGGYYVVSLDASSVPNPTSVTFSGNTQQGIQVRGGGIGTSALWKKWHTNAPYAVTGFVIVEEGNTLSIEPTATVKVSGVAFHVYGTLTANSTTGRITFTSLLDDSIGGDTNGDGTTSTPAAGNWRGIYLAPTAGASVLTNCTIRYAGAYNGGYGLSVSPHGWVWAALYVDGISPVITGGQILDSETSGIKLWSSKATITGTAFQNMGGDDYPIVLDTTDCYPVMGGNSTSGTGYNGVALRNGTIGVTGTWSRPGVNFPYLMRGQIVVDTLASLTIAPGNTIRSNGDALHVYGGLTAAGTSTQPILFSSRAASPVPGSWRGIYLAPTAAVTAFSYVTIEYAGAHAGGFGLNVAPHGWVWAALYLDGISPLLANVTIRSSETYGIQLYGAAPTIINGRFETCGTTQVAAVAGSKPTISGSRFLGASTVYGVATDTPAQVIIARNNYWGDVSGPFDPSDDRTSGGWYNPAGLGARVSDGVDYSSWRTTADPQLTIIFAGTGGGNVTGPGISCTGTCSYFKPEGSYTLLATGDADSVFDGWGGGCNGTGDCTVNLISDVQVTGSFRRMPPARIDGVETQYFETLQSAFNGVTGMSVIMLRDYLFAESVVYAMPYAVTIRGGYDKSYSTSIGASILQGSFTVGPGGGVTINGFTIK